MARGRGNKQRGGGGRGGRGRPSRGGRQNSKKYGLDKLNQKSDIKRDASHLREFGEAHPSEDAERRYRPSDKRRKFDEKSDVTNRRKDVDSDEESIEEQPHDHFKQLLSIFSGLEQNKSTTAIDSDESEEPESDTSDEENGLESEQSDLGLRLEEGESNQGSDQDRFLQTDSESDSDDQQEVQISTEVDEEPEEEPEEEIVEQVRRIRLTDLCQYSGRA